MQLNQPVVKRKDQVKAADAYEHNIVENADAFSIVITGGQGRKEAYGAENLKKAISSAQALIQATAYEQEFMARDVMVYGVKGTNQALAGTWSRKFGWRPTHDRYIKLLA